MIKFFRHIRRQLLGEGKTGKYFKYALGEILLVMIGILLALQVNNWNEKKNEKKDEKRTLKALLSELDDNKNLIQLCLKGINESKQYGDSLKMHLGPKLTTLKNEDVNRFIGEVGYVNNCGVRTDILKDLQGSGKLNLITSDSIRIHISRWSSSLKLLQDERDEWAQEFSAQFIPFTNKWIQWDDVDYYLYEGEYGSFKSEFSMDSRLILQQPEFSNVIYLQNWRMTRVIYFLERMQTHTEELIKLIELELD